MPRAKRKPYDPSAKTYDRRSTDLNLGIRNHMAPIEVDDPMEAGAKLIVMRAFRTDPLARLHARRMIDDAQYHGGRAFQEDFETIQSSPQAIDLSVPYVDRSFCHRSISNTYSKAFDRLNAAHAKLGIVGSAISHDFLIHCRTESMIAEMRGLSGKDWENHFLQKLRECLDVMAKLWGFTNG